MRLPDTAEALQGAATVLRDIRTITLPRGSLICPADARLSPVDRILPRSRHGEGETSSKYRHVLEEVIELVRIAPGHMGKQTRHERIKPKKENHRTRLVSDKQKKAAYDFKNHRSGDGDRRHGHSDLPEIAHIEIMLDEFVVARNQEQQADKDAAGEKQNIPVLFEHGFLPISAKFAKSYPARQQQEGYKKAAARDASGGLIWRRTTSSSARLF
jgi:hypothetical protein